MLRPSTAGDTRTIRRVLSFTISRLPVSRSFSESRSPLGSHHSRETALVALLASVISLTYFFYYLRHGDLLLYGDAVAHINIARRVFDSRTPGLLQLGTVWLPLPHLAMIPFVISDWLWRTGVGGSISSMTAYVFGVVGMFRILRDALRETG